MQPSIDLVTLLTDDVPAMTRFYRDVVGLPISAELDGYTGFAMDGVRFAVCSRKIMLDATGHPAYRERFAGQSVELAFRVDDPNDMQRVYDDLIAKGAAPVKPPADMPWGQRTAFFADPEGNIHEIAADLPKE